MLALRRFRHDLKRGTDVGTQFVTYSLPEEW